MTSNCGIIRTEKEGVILPNEARKRIEEDFKPILPPDDIVCKNCSFRKADLKHDGKVIVHGYKNGYCKIYDETIGGKPNEILFENAKCKYYTKDDESG